jgi:hypothetical protein
VALLSQSSAGRLLPDAEWAEVAAEVMERTGLAPRGDEVGVRWVAVRHAPDHVHIMATLARQDGNRPGVWNDFYRVLEACQAAERRFGLQGTAPADRTAARRPTRVETEQAARRKWREPPRVTLRREVCVAAAAASSENEFFDRLREADVLVRQRFRVKQPGEVTGYAVGLTQHLNGDGGVVWYGGGRLAADLTLPKLRRRWDPRSVPTPRPTSHRVPAEERNTAYEDTARTARRAADHIRHCAARDPGQAADAAWAAADTLHVAARVLRNPELRRAADGYDRAARAPYGRVPQCTSSGGQLRLAAWSMAGIGLVAGADERAAELILSLARLSATPPRPRPHGKLASTCEGWQRTADMCEHLTTERRGRMARARLMPRMRSKRTSRLASRCRCGTPRARPRPDQTPPAAQPRPDPSRATGDHRHANRPPTSPAIQSRLSDAHPRVSPRPDFCHPHPVTPG